MRSKANELLIIAFEQHNNCFSWVPDATEHFPWQKHHFVYTLAFIASTKKHQTGKNAAIVDPEFLFQSWCSCQTICQWIFLPSMPINSGSFTICNKIPHESFGVNLLCIIETPIWCCQGQQTSCLQTPHPTNNFLTTPLRFNPKQM